MSRGSRNQLGAVVALTAMATAPPVAAEGKAPPELPPIPEGPPESIHAEAGFVESDVVAENRKLAADLFAANLAIEDYRERQRVMEVRRAEVVEKNGRLLAQLESQRAFFETRLQEQAATFDASWAERESEFAAQLQAPPFASAMAAFERTPIGTFAATVLGHRPRRAVFDASVPLTVAGRRVTYGPGDPVPDHIDPATLPVGAVRYLSEEGSPR